MRSLGMRRPVRSPGIQHTSRSRMQLKKIDVAVGVGVLSSHIVLVGRRFWCFVASDIFDRRNVISNAPTLHL